MLCLVEKEYVDCYCFKLLDDSNTFHEIKAIPWSILSLHLK